MTARYILNGKTETWKNSLENAVCKTILRHPNLSTGILNEGTNEPIFVRLDGIDLSDHIEYQEIPCTDFDRSLEQILETQHSHFFRDLDRRSPWKLIIVHSNAADSSRVSFEAIFSFHHALGDGKSGFIFHSSILEALNSSREAVKLEGWTLKIPKLVDIPPPIEKQLDFRVSWSFFLERIWEQYNPIPTWMKPSPPWVSTPCLRGNSQDYRSRVKFIPIDADQVSQVTSACRENGTTLTGLLQGIIVTSLTLRVAEATSFIGGVPYSMRHLFDSTIREEIGVYVSGLLIQYPLSVISGLRSSRTDEELTHEIWEVARLYKDKMNAKLAQGPNNLDMGLLPWVKDLTGMFRARMNRPRSATFETSNVGIFAGRKATEKWSLERMVFSQSGQLVDGAVCFNSASVAGGRLVIAVTWLDGAIKERLVDDISRDLEHGLHDIGKRGLVSFV